MLTSISRPALLCLPYPAREHLSPILPGANVAGNSGLICCRQALQPSINSACRTAQFPPGEWGGGGSREKRQRYLIASSAQFPCLAPTVCVCDLFYSFIQLYLLVFLPCEYRFARFIVFSTCSIGECCFVRASVWSTNQSGDTPEQYPCPLGVMHYKSKDCICMHC